MTGYAIPDSHGGSRARWRSPDPAPYYGSEYCNLVAILLVYCRPPAGSALCCAPFLRADILEHAFLIRRPQQYISNLPKRIVRSPKVYFTDTGLLHAFLGINASRQLDISPQRGLTWEGFIIEQIIRRERLAHPPSRFYFWRTATGAEIDLLVERGQQLIGIEIKVGTRIDAADWRHLRAAMDELKLARAFVVNQSESAYMPFPGLCVVPASELLGFPRWIL